MPEVRKTPPPKGQVAIFDDEPAMGRILVKTLQLDGYRAEAFTDPEEGLAALEQFQADVLLTDVRMPKLNGMAVLERMRRDYPDVPVLIITAFGTVEGAVEAMRAGAFNYITKPFQQAQILAQIERAMELRRLALENARLSEEFSLVGRDREILGRSRAIDEVRRMIERAGPTDSSVLVTGESGVGKDLVARAIHTRSRRGRRRFVAINCPSIPPSLIESEMFGYERGAFTGADRSKMGLVELAQGGTLFLDEIAELPAEMQVKLLRMIQEREIQRVGGLKQISVDLRLIAATNRDLKEEMAAGRFREDLFFRLNVIHIAIPPLREHIEDVALLAETFARRAGSRLKGEEVRLSAGAVAALREYSWPGNVRELENVIERTLVLSEKTLIEREDLALAEPGERDKPEGEAAGARRRPGIGGEWPPNYLEAREMFEREYLMEILGKAGGNVTQAARLSGISRRNLYDKLNRLGLI